jgi:hypothetical protein
MATEQYYFVLHLGPSDEPWPEPGKAYEIQILDRRGRAETIVHVDEREGEVERDGYRIPQAVIEAARRQLPGSGDYVNRNGETVQPF